MERKFVVVFWFILVFCFGSIGCYGQSNNNEQRLIGTWIEERTGATVVFNSDGTFSQTIKNTWGNWDDVEPFKYGFAVNKIALYYHSKSRGQFMYYLGDCFVSTDGKTLIITSLNDHVNLNGLYRKKT